MQQTETSIVELQEREKNNFQIGFLVETMHVCEQAHATHNCREGEDDF